MKISVYDEVLQSLTLKIRPLKGIFFSHKMKILSSFTYLLVVLNTSFFLTEQFMVPFDFYHKGVIKYKIKYCIS